LWFIFTSDVNKATSHKAKAKATLLAATVLNQIKTSDVTYCRASQLFS